MADRVSDVESESPSDMISTHSSRVTCSPTARLRPVLRLPGDVEVVSARRTWMRPRVERAS